MGWIKLLKEVGSFLKELDLSGYLRFPLATWGSFVFYTKKYYLYLSNFIYITWIKIQTHSICKNGTSIIDFVNV